MKSAAAAIALVLICAATARAQPAAGVDFPRDVQPIFREHCYGCHGPELQMNGFRLDRRADAMRGGQQTNIGPGNADGSRLFQRIAGSKLGARMPPAGPLSDEQIEIVRQWIDEGAPWPDAVSGETPAPPADARATRLIDAIRAGEAARVTELLKADAAPVNAYGTHGETPLMAAALYGDAALVTRLLTAGANPNARATSRLTPLMLAVASVESAQVLLDAGADVNARSEEGRSALLIASGTSGASPVVRLLLEYGADPFPWQASDLSPLREASRINDAETFRQLMSYGLTLRSPGAPPANYVRTTCAACAAMAGAGGPLALQPPVSNAAATTPIYDPGRLARPTPVAAEATPTPELIRAAVERSLPLLQQVDATFIQRTGCVSCHHNSLVAMTVATARSHGYRVDDTITLKQNHAIGAYLESWRERVLQNVPIAGGADTMSYLLFGLAAAGYAPDAATDAQAIWLKRRQAADGRWALNTLRPPIESNDVAVTAVSLRALQAFAPPARRAEYAKAVDRARAWLTTAHAEATEERAFRLLGLFWSHAPAPAVADAARELAASQRLDGGWSQEEKMTSDVYATGQALVALRESGAMSAADPVFRKGVEFLLRTQMDDGSWIVETRAVPIQAYFESGFPYGANQWISAAATAWATAALALAR